MMEKLTKQAMAMTGALVDQHPTEGEAEAGIEGTGHQEKMDGGEMALYS
jgi:hypothetical protein